MSHTPTGGTFVVFTVDLVASVAHLENPELTAACSDLQLSQKQFVAYIRRVESDFPRPWRRLNAFQFLLVWQGHENVPGPLKARDVSPNMLFPVLPNTYQPGSCHRHRTVSPCQPLPWNDCYISEVAGIDVRCEVEWKWTETEDRSAQYQTTFEEEIRVSRQMDTDSFNIYQHRVPISPASPSRGSFNSDLSSDPSVTEWRDSEVDLLNLSVADLVCGFREMDDKVVVQYTADLSTVDRVNHPDELFKFLARFERIKDEMERSHKLRQIEETRRIDEEYFARTSLHKSSCMIRPSLKSNSEPFPGLGLKRCCQKLREMFKRHWMRRPVPKKTDHMEYYHSWSADSMES
ncbi:hypothetical protein K435DRAFT_809734 [Dendrothele bispora CBS 962.96]|uniref:Uncharacterized protein n=1 Tax=Dendrothele bispora (strain CBS 962.96) TaxID=1314807 RepID=A0A4S8KX88_DENBC|nr:hypothetical protein K435DRAFT_809734 [Dendrothele bispora CBS 962.96]